MIFWIFGIILFIIVIVIVQYYILDVYVFKKPVVDKLIDWPPIKQPCPDYWDHLYIGDKQYCVINKKLAKQRKACKVGEGPKSMKPPILQPFPNGVDNLPNSINDANPTYKQYYGQNYFSLDNLDTAFEDCSSGNNKCKCLIAQDLCNPWTGVSDNEKCKLTNCNPCTPTSAPSSAPGPSSGPSSAPGPSSGTND